jgi:hypothetical protein
LVQSQTFARKIPTSVATVLHKKSLQYGLRSFPGLGGWRQDDLGQAGQGRITVTGKEMRVLRLFCRKYVSIILPGPDVTYEPGRNGFNGYIQIVLRSKSGRLVIKLFIG